VARAAGLRAIAVTDHDTLCGVAEAQSAAGPTIEIIQGVELSTEFCGREFHLLGYFIRTDHAGLNSVLVAACAARRVRFRDFLKCLRAGGLAISEEKADRVERLSVSLGRRHVASLVVASGLSRTPVEAVHRFVNPLDGKVSPKSLVSMEAAIALVHAAGGVAALAHPPATLTDEQFGELRGYGLDAVEAVYPWGRNSAGARLRAIAARFGFAISGGSDCHGPDPAHRRIGSHTLSAGELAALRERAGCVDR
jgi:predicted metal-dependent phosphoesterase TrpH